MFSNDPINSVKTRLPFSAALLVSTLTIFDYFHSAASVSMKVWLAVLRRLRVQAIIVTSTHTLFNAVFGRNYCAILPSHFKHSIQPRHFSHLRFIIDAKKVIGNYAVKLQHLRHGLIITVVADSAIFVRGFANLKQ